ncbi:MAG: hypothetical protein JWR26_2234, partial [Pedosphaera sp.]|nr:hypothetical protein [Pedosphaera sp.]
MVTVSRAGTSAKSPSRTREGLPSPGKSPSPEKINTSENKRRQAAATGDKRRQAADPGLQRSLFHHPSAPFAPPHTIPSPSGRQSCSPNRLQRLLPKPPNPAKTADPSPPAQAPPSPRPAGILPAARQVARRAKVSPRARLHPKLSRPHPVAKDLPPHASPACPLRASTHHRPPGPHPGHRPSPPAQAPPSQQRTAGILPAAREAARRAKVFPRARLHPKGTSPRPVAKDFSPACPTGVESLILFLIIFHFHFPILSQTTVQIEIYGRFDIIFPQPAFLKQKPNS